MKIALIGYGKMGKAIEEIALSNGDEVVLKITSSNKEKLNKENLSNADAAIEFTNPQSAVKNIKLCIDAGIPVVSGTTGWLKQFDEAVEYCLQKNGCFLYASNFSIGVNIFFEVNKFLAQLMHHQTGYDVTMEEIHHTQKKDAPSGTAITIAQQIIQNLPAKEKWVNAETTNNNELQIISKRINDVPGTHEVMYNSFADDIKIVHTAHNRSGFAAGALQAAKFVIDKKGIFEMRDVLGLDKKF